MWTKPSSACRWMVEVHCPPSTTSVPESARSQAASSDSAPPARSDGGQRASNASALTTAAGHGAVDLTLAFPLLGIFTFVPTLLAVDQRQLGFDAPLLLV